MNPTFVVSALLVLAAATILGFLFRQLSSQRRLDSVDPEWISKFSIARYKPMERLLLKDDYAFLAAQPGYDPSILRRLRAERRKIFRHYFRCLKKDFHRLENTVRLYMVHASDDRPELAKALFRQRLVFSFAVMVIECHLLLHGFGLGTVDIRGVVGSLEAMRAQLGQLALHRQASAAY